MLLFFYSVCVALVYLLALPFLLILSFKQKYRQSLPLRFFPFFNKRFIQDESIWFHAASLGEVNALKELITKMDESVCLSVITQTGFNSAKKIENADVRYLPFEIFLPFWIRKPKVLVVMEAELWPLLFLTSKTRGAKTILMNARISDNSYTAYKRFAFFYRWIFLHVDKVFAQSQLDKKRLEELGAKDVIVNGNIKTSQSPKLTCKYKKPSKEVITLASTHEGEEELLLKSIELKKNQMLIVVPRHPERFAKIDTLLKEYAKKYQLYYSKLSDKESFESDIVLCDKMGELVNIYAITDVTYLGGSFVDGVGGHNPVEPAFFNNKIISGEYFFNQKPLYKLIKNIEIQKVEELKSLNYDLLEKSEVLYKGEIESLLEEIRKK